MRLDPKCCALLVSLVVCAPLVGCSALAAALWVTGQGNVKPEFDGFREKKVAVVARPVISLAYRDAHVDKELARRVHTILAQKVRKATWIDPQTTERWTDEHDWDTFVEVGKGVGADLVLGIEIEDFTLFKGQTVYQGKAALNLVVYDCATGNRLYEKNLPEILYPPNSVVPSSEVPEAAFRRQFVSILGEAVARHFHSYDPHGNWIRDAPPIR